MISTLTGLMFIVNLFLLIISAVMCSKLHSDGYLISTIITSLALGVWFHELVDELRGD